MQTKTKTKRALSASTIASLLITSSAVAVNVKAAAVTPPESPRLWGQDRYETAVKVSQAGWDSGSDYAVIASGEGYADALCAAPLAKANNAPILLTQKGTLTENTLNELKRLKVKHIFIVGGQGVVSQEVENKIKSEVTSDIQRLWGQNRYETAVKVAEKIGTPAKVVLASGDGYADALSAAPVAAVEGMPILLTESSTLSTATANYIKANAGITKTYVIGGTASVSDATMKDVPNAQRLGGADRYETNAKVIDAFSTDFNFKNAYVALGNGPTGNEFADALSASAIAAKNGNAVIITNKSLNSTTQTLAKSKLFPSSTITVIGGTANVPNEVVTGMKVSGSLLSEAGKTYTDAIDGNAEITADNVTVKGNVKGDLYLSGNNASISNITVDGTIYVNPGAAGVSNLDTVTAKNIVVLSGAKDSIHLKNVKADKLTVQSRDNVRIASEGTTAISSTVVSSQVILEATAGSFGNVNLAQTAVEKTVELRGTFDKPVVVTGQVNLKAAANANIAKLEIAPQAKQDKVNIDGNFKDVEVTKEANLNVAATAKITGTVTLKVVAVITTAKGADISNLVVTAEVKGANIEFNGEGTIKNIQNKSVLVIIDIAKDVSVTGKIESVNKDNVTSENTSTTGKVEEKPSDSMTDISTGTTTPPTGGGGAGGGTTYTDITSLVSKIYGDNLASRIQNHPTLKNDVSVNATGNPIVVTLLNTNLESLQTVFNNVENEDLSLIKSRLTKAQDLMNLHSSLMNVDGVPFSQYLAQAEAKYLSSGGNDNYINTNGSFNIDNIASRIKNSTLTYSEFKNALKARVEAMCNETKNAPTVTVSVDGISETVTKIVKDGTTIYDTNSSIEANIVGLINLGDTTTGTYTIYCGTYYFTVQVTK